jgi:hypothetical protein
MPFYRPDIGPLILLLSFSIPKDNRPARIAPGGAEPRIGQKRRRVGPVRRRHRATSSTMATSSSERP